MRLCRTYDNLTGEQYRASRESPANPGGGWRSLSGAREFAATLFIDPDFERGEIARLKSVAPTAAHGSRGHPAAFSANRRSSWLLTLKPPTSSWWLAGGEIGGSLGRRMARQVKKKSRSRRFFCRRTPFSRRFRDRSRGKSADFSSICNLETISEIGIDELAARVA
jgi:hypothetical protein